MFFEVIRRRVIAPDLTVHNHLTASIAAGLEQDGIHPHVRLAPGRLPGCFRHCPAHCRQHHQTEQAGGQHHPVGAGDILHLHQAQRIAQRGLFVQLAKVPGLAGQLNPQRTRTGGFRLGRVRAGMLAPIPTPDTPGVRRIVSGEKGRGNPEQSGQPGGDVSGRIVQFCGGPTEVQVFVVFVAHHAVHGVDGLVGQTQRRAADEQVEHGGNDAVREVFRDGFHRRLGYTFTGEGLGVPPHHTADCFSGGKQITFTERFIHMHGLHPQILHRQRLPAPQHLHRKAQCGMNPACQPDDTCAESERSQRQNRRQHHAAPEQSARRIRQKAAQQPLQPGDGLTHVHHRVGHPAGVAQNQVDTKAQQNSQQNRHACPPLS